MAKGIPLMGRDPDGNAKIINVDENGNVKVQQSGQIVAQSHVGEVVVGPGQQVNILEGTGFDHLSIASHIWGLRDGAFIGFMYTDQVIGEGAVEYRLRFLRHPTSDFTNVTSVDKMLPRNALVGVPIPFADQYARIDLHNVGDTPVSVRYRNLYLFRSVLPSSPLVGIDGGVWS